MIELVLLSLQPVGVSSTGSGDTVYLDKEVARQRIIRNLVGLTVLATEDSTNYYYYPR